MNEGFGTILTETITSENNKNPRIWDFLSVELRKEMQFNEEVRAIQ